MDALQLLTWSLILYLFASLASLFYSVWTDWLLSFPASHRWWAARLASSAELRNYMQA